MPKILYLLDGHAIAYRSYFALTSGGTSPWESDSGEPVAGVYGFANALIRILEQEQPDYLAVAFDTGKTFRHELYPAYKGTRAKMPDDLRSQIDRIREMVDCFNIPRMELENYEADDVIGSLAVWASTQAGLGVKIITGDRDLLQLVNNRIIVSLPAYRSGMNEDYSAEDVVRRMGVLPEQIVDYKALRGDPSDNIPGVPGIGEVTAVALIKQYGSLDAVLEHAGELTGRAGKALVTGQEMALLSQKLARIRTDLPVRLNLQQAEIGRFDPQAVELLFAQLGFRSLMPRLRALGRKLKPSLGLQAVQGTLFADLVSSVPAPLSAPSDAPEQGEMECIIVDKPEALQACLNELSSSTQIAFDTETTAVDPMRADLVGISLSANPHKGYYIPIGHHQGQQLAFEEILPGLQALLSNPAIAKVGHNAKFDLIVLHQAGIEVSPIRFDTMIAEWLINPASRNLGLKNLALARLNVGMTHIEELIGTGKRQISMAEVPISQAAPYAIADAVMTLRLVPLLQADLQTHHAEKLNRELEVVLISILAKMEENGILLQADLLSGFSAELQKDLARLEAAIYQQAGYRFNINSTQQLSDLLFVHLKLPLPDGSKKTSAGKYSTSADVLESMRGAHPIIALILEYREQSKLKSTYVDALPEQINPRTGRVHSTFNQTGTVTGRLASQNPNLQNLPARSEQGRRVRQAFIAPPAHSLLSIDYSQIELRIVAHMAQDKAMLSAFQRGEDIHAATAAAITHTPLDQVTKQQRRHAKAINFGLIYGMSPYGLTRTSDLTLAEAENFVKEYFTQFPGVKAWLDKTRREAAQNGYVETLLGRRRYFPNLQTANANFALRQREEREAINAPVQGTAADIIKLAMSHLPEALASAGLRAKILLQVHDELIFEVPDEQLAETVRVAQAIMEAALPLDVPLITEAKVGKNWGELESVEEDSFPLNLDA